jgi:hypothetical protein
MTGNPTDATDRPPGIPDWPPERWAAIWAASDEEWLARHPPDWAVIDAARAERGLPPEPWPLGDAS